MVCRHEEGVVDGRRQKVDDPFISGRASGGGGMIVALVDDVSDLLLDYFNSETVLVILVAVLFAICIEIFSSHNAY